MKFYTYISLGNHASFRKMYIKLVKKCKEKLKRAFFNVKITEVNVINTLYSTYRVNSKKIRKIRTFDRYISALKSVMKSQIE